MIEGLSVEDANRGYEAELSGILTMDNFQRTQGVSVVNLMKLLCQDWYQDHGRNRFMNDFRTVDLWR